MKKNLKGIEALLLIACFTVVIAAGCAAPTEAPSADTSKPAVAEEADAAPAMNPDEEYVLVSVNTALPLFIQHEYRSFEEWGKKMGVKTSIVGPPAWDVEAQVEALEQIIAQRPAGILANGSDPQIAVAVNEAVAAGIPIITFDGEVPGAYPLGHVGTNWYNLGITFAAEMAKKIDGKGKVANFGVLGIANCEAAYRGIEDTFAAKYPDIEYVGKFDTSTDLATSAKNAADLVAAYPDLAGVIGVGFYAGPGIGQAITDAGKVGVIKVVSTDAQPEQLKFVRSGAIQVTLAQKRELFSWYGAQFLYDYVHGNVDFTNDDKGAKIHTIPNNTDTGVFVVTLDNIDIIEEPIN